jgi:hypothetical protein
MPELPQRKVGIVACSGEELPGGTVTRQAVLKVLEGLRPSQTVTICLPLFLAGGEGDRAFARFYPTIAVDGCEKRCAARATELYSNKPAAAFTVDEIVTRHDLPRPQGLRRLTPESNAVVDALASAIAAEVDHLIAVRCLVPDPGDGVRESRGEGAIMEPAMSPAAVNTATCACGSGIPITTVELCGRSVEILALEPILDLAYGQGLRPNPSFATNGLSGGRPAEASLTAEAGPAGLHGGARIPAEIMEKVRVYNAIPPEDEALWEKAVTAAWRDYCLAKETRHGI